MSNKDFDKETSLQQGRENEVILSPEERLRQRTRNIAIGVVLGSLFILFYILTVARLGANVFSRPF